jgi:hypothetical protein
MLYEGGPMCGVFSTKKDDCDIYEAETTCKTLTLRETDWSVAVVVRLVSAYTAKAGVRVMDEWYFFHAVCVNGMCASANKKIIVVCTNDEERDGENKERERGIAVL